MKLHVNLNAFARKLLVFGGIVIMMLMIAQPASSAQFTVPLMKEPPTLDGFIDADEWAASHAFEGFIVLNAGTLEQRRVRAWVGATADTIYVAIASRLPDEGQLLANIDRPSLRAVYDDSIEIYLNPTPANADSVDYQFLSNSLGYGGYNIHKLGMPDEEEAWQGNWKHAHAMHDGWWHFECAIPVDTMSMTAAGRKTTDGVWGINLTRNWKPDWAWTSLSGGYSNSSLLFAFTDAAAPAVRVHTEGHPAYPPNKHVLTVHNPSNQPLRLRAGMQMFRNRMPELTEEKQLTLAAGATQQLTIPIGEDDPTTVFELTAKVTDAGGTVVYYDRKTRWNRSESVPRWVVGKPADAPPLDFRFAYYPSTNVMRINADISGLPDDAKPARVIATVREHWRQTEIKSVEFPLAGFVNGRQEQRFELPPLDGSYDVVLKVEGENIPEGAVVKDFERKVFPWEKLPTGRSTKVYPPFTPLEVEGNTLRSVLRTHELNAFGLLDQVTGTSAQTGVSKPILAEPMRYTASVNGKEAQVRATNFEVVSSQPHEVVTQGSFEADALRAAWKNTWDYDGCVKVELTLHPTGETPIEELTLEIPFSAEQASMIHANADRIRAPIARRLPEREGELWNGSQVACDDYIPNFTPYVFIGNAVRGLCWFAENDLNWGWDPDTPNMRLAREGDRVVLRIHLINEPTVIRQPRTITFGMLAAPVKPMLSRQGQANENPNWWRYRYLRDRYNLLGTDINWFGNGSCGAVYPVNEDLYLWEMLARGNRERLSDQEINAFAEYGRKHWEGRGQAAMDSWIAHARHNLRSRYGMNMVFYYNRAASQEQPEFQTFKHEWSLQDYCPVGKGRGRGEIKIVPTDSYIDFNLYWYARSFEIGNNKGAYWDNLFIAPSFNTEFTDAYRREDGSIVPAAGIWGQRELVKRTFIMMNERGMLPITFPHMTSFNPLPMMSFATVQYEWEWKYSTGNVQNRYSREYIQLVTTGELAGVWPVPLHDHGSQATDPWIQRTFAAVRLAHELDGIGGTNQLFRPVVEMLDTPGLDVYRYWDERPQPAITGNDDIPTIVYSVPGKEAVVGVVSYAREDADVNLKIDLAALGLTRGVRAVNAETGGAMEIRDGVINFTLKSHDVLLVKIAGE